MVAKVKTEEVSLIEGKLNSNEITDFKVMIKNKEIGSIFQETIDGQIKLTYKNGRKGSAASIEEGLRSIIADYNLHN